MSAPVPTLPPDLSRTLRRAVGRDGLIEDPARLLAYESDALTTRRGTPLAAVFPPWRDALVEVARALAGAGVPFVPRGAGTGLAGGAVADGAVLVCTSRMNRILDVDPEDRSALLEPGVLTADLAEAARRHGLRYLPDPASASACTVGGNVATNAGGPHCLRHGVTRDHVLELELVLPSGDPVWLDRGDDGGLDLAALVIGGEGTLGIVSRIRVALHPSASTVRTLLAAFDHVGDAGRVVSALLEAGVVPVAVELVDATTIRLVEDSELAVGLPGDAGAALVVECEGETDEVAEGIGRAEEVARSCGAREIRTAAEPAERERIWRARKAGYGLLGRSAPDIFVQDAAVPRTALPDLLPAIERVAERHRVRLANFFHAGDGNLHPNLLFDRRDAGEVRRVEAAGAEIMEACVEAGGTISGEHGIGLDKVHHMQLVFGAGELAALRRLRRAFDPRERANPGKLLPGGRSGRETPRAAPPGPLRSG